MLTIARRFSGSSICRKQITVGSNNIQVIKNIQDREYEAIWKTIGSTRSDLKKDDIKKFKEAWGNDYHQTLTFLKDSDRLIASNSHVVFRPLKDSKGLENLVFRGNLWISPDVRGSEIMDITDKQSYDVGFSVGNNSMAYATKKTMDQYKNLTGSMDHLHKYYVSNYDFGDLCIPKDLDTSGIVVKNARDVPDTDILKYDAKVFKYERSKYVLGQIREDFGRVAYNEKGDVIGIGAISVYPSGECAITPMYADDIRIARTILKNILEEMTLDAEKYWRLQIRSHDQHTGSYGWIRPFLSTMTHRSEVCTLMCDHKEKGMDFSKVYSTFHADNCPI
ncbi:DUF1248 domain-containing protein [Caenorhabditis elegans]|uniref:DUF1248 domain-containing protein n=1 Tax=Caenorhabditis elegans TaxID=6239 RepID=Q23414_CAEEL|nr:DUF1248 domain-containing protein [Caenorhabditis elegans]CCD72507.1 DUF1248 domain-containing protein [Caenorhabditis elegans]|eukprot:NP_495150.1 Uncharacterized protein CELE_ZK1248.5 [Caenorhabditis elegans]